MISLLSVRRNTTLKISLELNASVGSVSAVMEMAMEAKFRLFIPKRRHGHVWNEFSEGDPAEVLPSANACARRETVYQKISKNEGLNFLYVSKIYSLTWNRPAALKCEW
jgi:hypothetical protein